MIRSQSVIPVVLAFAIAGAAPLTGEARQAVVHGSVVAAEPDAADAGLKVLKAGGGAVDAAVAVQAVLGLEEPQSSGLGGGAFLVFYNAKTHVTTVYNGRETAPATATEKLFFDVNGKPLSFMAAILSGRSTGAPGAIAMLARAHADHGKRPWASLFGDAERLADQGFIIPPRFGAAIHSGYPQTKTPDASAYFTRPDGQLYATGDTLKNPAYALAVRRIAAQGVKGLLAGVTGREIVAHTRSGEPSGDLTLQDLAAYRPQILAPLCRTYHGYTVCSAPPPAGGVGVLELLNLLEHTDIATRGPKDPQAWYEFAEASRLAYADRDHFEGDPDFVKTPVDGLLDPTYGAARAALIGTLGPDAPLPGHPPGAAAHGADATREPGGTTHFVIVDADGNIVSMTTTVESIFGSGRMASGFFLNNQLTDFSAPVGVDGQPAANAPGPRKRPRSSMSPVIVFDADGRPVAALGSPGGNSIIAYVAKALVGWIDWKLPLQEAVDLPNVVARRGTVSIEKGMDPTVVAFLRSKGLNVQADAGEVSGLNGLVLRNGEVVETAVDHRREAVARRF